MKFFILILFFNFSSALWADQNSTLAPGVSSKAQRQQKPLLDKTFAQNSLSQPPPSTLETSKRQPTRSNPASAPPTRYRTTPRDEITGIVIDESFTPLAKEFSQGFSQIWRNQPTKPRYSVTLKEDKSALRGNKISVTFRRQVVYIANLNRRKDNVEIGKEAAKSVIRKLRVYSTNASKDPDLAEDEF